MFQAIANRLSLRSPGSTLFPFAKTLNKTIDRGGNSTFPKFVFFSQKLLKGSHKTAKDITLKAVCVENVLPVSFSFNKKKVALVTVLSFSGSFRARISC